MFANKLFTYFLLPMRKYSGTRSFRVSKHSSKHCINSCNSTLVYCGLYKEWFINILQCNTHRLILPWFWELKKSFVMLFASYCFNNLLFF